MDSLSATPAPRVMARFPVEPPPHAAALRRAAEAARDVPGDFIEEPWRFYPMSAEKAQALAWLNARRIEEEAGPEAAAAAYEQWRSVPGWVIVTCPRTDDPAQQAHYRERCLTAVQRFSLSLWSEAIRTSWIADLEGEETRFADLADFDPAREELVGLLLYGHAERSGG